MKPMVSKETFCKTIQALFEFLIHMEASEWDAAEVLGLPFDDVFSRYRKELMDVVVDFVGETMHDEEGILSDFIYEMPSKGDEFDLYVPLRCGKEI